MAKQEVIFVKCDKCGTESQDLSKFLHVTVEAVVPDGKKRPKPLSSRDLCIETCVGAPAVNREL